MDKQETVVVVRYVRFLLFLTLDLDFLFAQIFERWPNISSVIIEKMPAEETGISDDRIQVLRERIHVYVRGDAGLERHPEIEKRVEARSPA